MLKSINQNLRTYYPCSLVFLVKDSGSRFSTFESFWNVIMSANYHTYMKTRLTVKRRKSLNSIDHRPSRFLPIFEDSLKSYTDKLSFKKLKMPEIPVLPGIQSGEEKIINNHPRPSVTTGLSKKNVSSSSRKRFAKSTTHLNSENSSTSSSTSSRHLHTNVETKRMLNSFFSNLIITPFIGQSQSVIVSSDNFSRFHRHDDNNKRQSSYKVYQEFRLNLGIHYFWVTLNTSEVCNIV